MAEKEIIKERASRAGFPGRGFATWARNVLLGKTARVKRPEENVDLMSAAEAATYCGVSRQQVYAWVQNGDLPFYDLPEGLRLSVADLDDWKAARAVR